MSALMQKIRWKLKSIRRSLPYIVWYDDELDVGVTIKELGGLGKEASDIWKVEESLSRMGIGFDSGSGLHGRDWEWDWSLRGPISVRFRGRSQNPEKRTGRPKPYLVSVNRETGHE